MSEGKKLKIALYWCASCGGCEEAVVDLAEDLLKLVEIADIVFWPVAMDFKKEDVEKMPDKSIDISFINGAIRLSEHEEMVKLLRRKSKLVVAFGSCAHLGGIPGLANLWRKEDIYKYIYHESPTVENPEGIEPQEEIKTPEGKLELPSFLEYAKPLNEVIKVDYYIPGCPPTPDTIREALQRLLDKTPPAPGTVLAGTRSLCDECPLNKTKPEKIKIKDFKRPHEVQLDPEKCYLAQGVLCLGPVTRSGCKALCIKGGMPCTGCYGPLDDTIDFGARVVSYLASIIDIEDEEEAKKFIEEKIVDPVGWFYRYSLPASLLKKRVTKR